MGDDGQGGAATAGVAGSEGSGTAICDASYGYTFVASDNCGDVAGACIGATDTGSHGIESVYVSRETWNGILCSTESV